MDFTPRALSPSVSKRRLGVGPSRRRPAAAAQRESILAAAAELFGTMGYAATSAEQISARANVAPGDFECLFAGKRDCILTLHDRLLGEASERLLAATGGAASWGDRVAAGLAGLLEAIEADLGGARVALVEIRAAGPEGERRYQAMIEACLPFLRSGRELRTASAPLPDFFESNLVGGIAFLFSMRLGGIDPRSSADAYADALYFLLEPYLGKLEARRIAALPRPAVGSE